MQAQTTIQRISVRVAFAVMIVLASLTPPLALSLPAQSASTLTSLPSNHQIAGAFERMELTVKTSRTLSLGTRIPRFQVHDEEVLGATPLSNQEIQISAKRPGTTQINVWDTDDNLYTIDVTVVADASPIETLLNSQLPMASLKVTPVNGAAIVSGLVTRADDVARAIAIVEQFYATVIDNVQVVGTEQVILRTRIMEVNCTKLRQLGLHTPWCSSSSRSGQSQHCFHADGHFDTLIGSLEQQRIVKLVAAPSVMATSGQYSRFVAGGRLPTVSSDCTGQSNIAYQEYGTRVDFLPLVIDRDRIRLQVRPELSEPDPSRSVTAGTTHLSAFTTRYVETTVEIPFGQTALIAGLMQSSDDFVIRRAPVLSEVPGIGKLFRKVHCEHNEIELLIAITPELVDTIGFDSGLDQNDRCQFGKGIISTDTHTDGKSNRDGYDDSEGMIDYQVVH